jgi:hypothetical protein
MTSPHDTPETAQHYAAHDDASIYGIGTSPETARQDAADQCGFDCSDLDVHPISRALYRLIWEAGWHANRDQFIITETGELVDTTTRLTARRARRV